MLVLVLLVVILVGSDAALVPSTANSTCSNSYACGSGMCCRDSSSGAVLSDHQAFGPNFGPLGNHNGGTCSTRKAQKGEVCDSHCQCDTGLACYRPVSGVCCPPMTCFDEAYVKQQQAYWSKCSSDPTCFYPP